MPYQQPNSRKMGHAFKHFKMQLYISKFDENISKYSIRQSPYIAPFKMPGHIFVELNNILTASTYIHCIDL